MEQETKTQTSTKKHEMVAPLLAAGPCAAGMRRVKREDSKIDIRFADNAHMEFYNGQADRLNPDSYLKALIYTLGICDDTRRRFDSMYDAKKRGIVLETLHAGWQTGGSTKATRLAFNLFTDCPATAYSGTGNPDFDECKRYSVSDIFCCGYAPLFVEAIKLRYPEYMREGGANAGLYF